VLKERLRRYVVEEALRRGGGATSWRRRYVVEEALRRGGGAMSWRRRYVVEEALRRGGTVQGLLIYASVAPTMVVEGTGTAREPRDEEADRGRRSARTQ
jgi:hypothetical protein